jgi:hypothetical protein
MEQDPFPSETKSVWWMMLLVMCIMHHVKKEPFRAMLYPSGSRHSMIATCGSRDIISLVTPRLGVTSSSYSRTCAHRRENENVSISGMTCVLHTQENALEYQGWYYHPLSIYDKNQSKKQMLKRKYL